MKKQIILCLCGIVFMGGNLISFILFFRGHCGRRNGWRSAKKFQRAFGA